MRQWIRPVDAIFLCKPMPCSWLARKASIAAAADSSTKFDRRYVWPDSCRSQSCSSEMWHTEAGVAAQCEGERTLLCLHSSKREPCWNIHMSCRSWMLTTAVSHRWRSCFSTNTTVCNTSRTAEDLGPKKLNLICNFCYWNFGRQPLDTSWTEF